MIEQRPTYLNGVDESLRISFELPLALVKLVRARSHDTAGTNRSFRYISRIGINDISFEVNIPRGSGSTYPLAMAKR